MESLRKQLAETQGALHEKIAQVRQLRVDQAATLTTWTQEKQSFEAKLQLLEDELRQLRHENQVAHEASGKASQTQEDGKDNESSSVASILMGEGMEVTLAGGEESVVIARSRIQDVESRFQDVTNQLAEKTNLCDFLQRQIEEQGGNVKIPNLPGVTDDLVVARWDKLRGQIRALSLAKFNTVIQPKLVPERSKREFEHLSTHWKSYLTGEKLTCYIFRALIWRYLHTCIFKKFWRIWGKEYTENAAELAGLFASKATGATDFQDWRIHTARLFHKICTTDPKLTGAVTSKIFEATLPFATGSDDEGLKKALLEIVAAAVDLSSLFARSQYMALMSDKPGSDLTRGFPYGDATMDVKGTLGEKSIVDLMVTPVLLKKEAEYFVLVKAEVIC
ncbi:hypothetical protein F5Y05DRAFT_382658 [Hypoxylon sp. FL0543]|nr:hypothetical protein F5Y05DRAFT_382658 [Hypoxylon sp. FL0543]